MSDNSSVPAPTRTEPGAELNPAKTKQSNPQTDLADVAAAVFAQQGLPPAKAGVVVQQITTEMTRLHLGPLPAVEDFEGYDKACPGAARDIVDMAVRQQKHQHWVEKADVVGDMLLPILGLIAAIVLVLAMLGTGVYLAVNGHEQLAFGVFTGTGIATVAGAVLQRKRTKQLNGAPPAQPNEQIKRKKK
jgi:uncharacterized membrane protein